MCVCVCERERKRERGKVGGGRKGGVREGKRMRERELSSVHEMSGKCFQDWLLAGEFVVFVSYLMVPGFLFLIHICPGNTSQPKHTVYPPITHRPNYTNVFTLLYLHMTELFLYFQPHEFKRVQYIQQKSD